MYIYIIFVYNVNRNTLQYRTWGSYMRFADLLYYRK